MDRVQRRRRSRRWDKERQQMGKTTDGASLSYASAICPSHSIGLNY